MKSGEYFVIVCSSTSFFQIYFKLLQLLGIPCIYGVSSIHYMKHTLEDYVDDYFKKEAYLKCYSYALEPLNGLTMWQEINEAPVLPSPFRKMPGRPKVTRKKSADEKQNPRDPNKLSRHGVSMRCTLCFEIGHNKRGCPHTDNMPNTSMSSYENSVI